MSDSFVSASLEEAFLCKNQCGKGAEFYCKDCQNGYCEECNKKIHQELKVFANHKVESSEKANTISLTKMTPQDALQKSSSKDSNSDVWIDPKEFKLFQVLSDSGAESKVFFVIRKRNKRKEEKDLPRSFPFYFYKYFFKNLITFIIFSIFFSHTFLFDF